jgi:hypothetical protein
MRPREMRRQVVTIPAESRPLGRPVRSRVVRLRPRLRLVTRADAPPPAFRRVAGGGILIRLDERRAAPARPSTSPDGVWLIVTLAAMLLSIVVWRFLP